MAWHIGIRSRQIAGVTAMVGVVVVALSGLYLSRLTAIIVQESHARAEMLANTVFHRVREIVGSAEDPYAALATDPGLRSILEASIYGEGVTGVAIVDPRGVIVAHSDPSEVGHTLDPRADLTSLLGQGTLDQLRVLYLTDTQTVEVVQPLVLDDDAFGTISIGLSPVLMRQALDESLRPALLMGLVALAISVAVAGLLAQRVLRPIHVLRTGITRLGRGERGVTLDLPAGDEFGELGNSFNTLSRQWSGGSATDAPATSAHRPQALSRLMAGLAHEVKNPLNAMMIHLELLRTKVRDSAAALTPPPPARASAGSETLGLSSESSGATLSEPLRGALEHASVIESELHRLDEVLQGFLKFTRPDELDPHAIRVSSLVGDLVPVIEADAGAHGVRVIVECPPDVWIMGDDTTLRQALLNLAINACQAMPDGGTLRVTCRESGGRRVEIMFEDTGTGIPPEQLSRIFDLYYTTKDHGSGLGLSMVYRILQLHDGDIDVESTPGMGTTFRLWLPRASES